MNNFKVREEKKNILLLQSQFLLNFLSVRKRLLSSLFICPFWPAEKGWFWPVYMERSKARTYIFPPQLSKLPRSGQPELVPSI